MLIWIIAVLVGAKWGFWTGFWTFVILAILADQGEHAW